MPKGRFIKSWTIAVVGIILIAVSPIRGVSVLCIGEPGHWEIEVIGSPCCEQVVTVPVPIASLMIGSADDCGSCIDVLFAHDVTGVSLNNLASRPAENLFGPLPNVLALSTVFPCDYCAPLAVARRDFTICSAVHSRFSAVIRC